MKGLFIYCYCLPMHLLYPNRMKERSFNYSLQKRKRDTTIKKRERDFSYFLLFYFSE